LPDRRASLPARKAGEVTPKRAEGHEPTDCCPDPSGHLRATSQCVGRKTHACGALHHKIVWVKAPKAWTPAMGLVIPFRSCRTRASRPNLIFAGSAPKWPDMHPCEQAAGMGPTKRARGFMNLSTVCLTPPALRATLHPAALGRKAPAHAGARTGVRAPARNESNPAADDSGRRQSEMSFDDHPQRDSATAASIRSTARRCRNTLAAPAPECRRCRAAPHGQAVRLVDAGTSRPATRS